jgi:hypothetical protein
LAEVDIAVPSTIALSIAGFSLGRSYCEPKSGLKSLANIYSMIFMKSGERKSTVFRLMTGPFHELARRTTDVDKQIFEARKRYELACKKWEQGGGQGQFPVKPEGTTHRFMTTNCTSEALVDLMEDSGGRAFLASSESRDMIQILQGKYSKTAGGDDTIFLSGYNADEPLVRHRKNKTVEILEPLTGLILLTQTDQLKQLFGSEMRQSGLLPRSLMILPSSRVGSRFIGAADNELDVQIQQAYNNAIADRMMKYYDIRNDSHIYHGINLGCFQSIVKCSKFELTAGALEYWHAFYNETEARLHPQKGDLKGVADFGSRWSGLPLRIAMILAEYGDFRQVISTVNMENAITLSRYYINCVANTLASAGVDVSASSEPLSAMAERIKSHICQKKPGKFTYSKVKEWLRLRGDDSEIRYAVDELITTGIVRKNNNSLTHHPDL